MLSDYLVGIGVELPIKLHYDYKLPKNMAPQDYERPIHELTFYHVFPESTKNMPEYKDLYGIEKAAIERIILRKAPAVKRKLKAEAGKIKKLNLELADIDVKIDNILGFLYGVIYGFAPEDIDWFINGRPNLSESQRKAEEDKSYDFQKDFTRLVGIETVTYVISPKHREALLTAAQARWESRRGYRYR